MPEVVTLTSGYSHPAQALGLTVINAEESETSLIQNLIRLAFGQSLKFSLMIRAAL